MLLMWFNTTGKSTKAENFPSPRFWTGDGDLSRYYITINPHLLEVCSGLDALSRKTSVPAWPQLPFGMEKIPAFEAALEWKAKHLSDKEFPLPDDNLTKDMIKFVNGEK